MFADPEKNLKSFGLIDGEIIADLGAGTGYYSLLCSELNPNGIVYAVDVVKDYLVTIANKARDQNLKNLKCIWGDIEKRGGTQIADHIVDKVIASNILFQVEDRDGFLEEMKRIMKPGAEVMLIDWSDAESALAPSKDRLISKEKAQKLMEDKGFVLKKDINTGEHHYGMIFKKMYK